MNEGIDFFQYSGGPTVQALAEKARAQISDPSSRLIPCPGGCGGEARTQRPMTIYRDGQADTVIPATCRGTCRQPLLKSDGTERKQNGKTITKPKQFLIPVRSEPAEIPTEKRDKVSRKKQIPKEATLVRKAIAKAGISQRQLSRSLGYGTDTVAQYLGGYSVSQERSDHIVTWAQRVLDRNKAPDAPEAARKAPEVSTVEPEPSSAKQESQRSEASRFPQQVLPDSEILEKLCREIVELLDRLQPENGALYIGERWEILARRAGSSADFDRPNDSSPYAAIVQPILERAAQAALERLSPEIGDQVAVQIGLRWKA